jgi:hypothetical protein
MQVVQSSQFKKSYKKLHSNQLPEINPSRSFSDDCHISLLNIHFCDKVHFMTVEQIIEIPSDRRISLEEVRQPLQKEMSEKGTLAVTTENGDDWEAHVMEIMK